MNLRNALKIALILLLLYLIPSFLQIITEVDVPELQLLASNLKPEECVKLVSLGSNSPLSETQIQKLARDQSCFRRLVKWICQLRTVTRNTYPILNDHLKRIGRKDLVACLAEFSMKTTNVPKVVRQVQPIGYYKLFQTSDCPPSNPHDNLHDNPHNNPHDNPHDNPDYDEYQPPNTTPKPKLPKEIEKIRFTTFTLSVQTATIIVISIILVTCCCTLFIKKKFGHLFDRLRGKKKKGKLIMIEEEGGDISRSYFLRKPRRKRKRAPSYEMVHTGTQNVAVPVTPKEPEETTKSPGCQRCFKKKRKRTAKRPHR